MNFTNNDIVVLAVYCSGGTAESIDIEHIADTASQIDRKRFSWHQFPDRIDLRKVQYALKNCLDESPRRLRGSISLGFQLTTAGLEWAQAHAPQSTTRHGTAGTPIDSEMGLILSERERLRQTTAYKKFTTGRTAELTRRDYESFVRINPYFSPPLRATRIQKVSNIVYGDEQLGRVWTHLQHLFPGDQDG